jgi:hypothetical protein
MDKKDELIAVFCFAAKDLSKAQSSHSQGGCYAG